MNASTAIPGTSFTLPSRATSSGGPADNAAEDRDDVAGETDGTMQHIISFMEPGK
jgi:hypothetical protein